MNLRTLSMVVLIVSSIGCKHSTSTLRASIDDFSFEVSGQNGRYQQLTIRRGSATQVVDFANMKVYEPQDLTELSGHGEVVMARVENKARPLAPSGLIEIGQQRITTTAAGLAITPFASATQGAIFVIDDGSGKKMIYKLFMDCFPDCGPQASISEQSLATAIRTKVGPEFGDFAAQTLGIKGHRSGVLKEFVEGDRLYDLIVESRFDRRVHGNLLLFLQFHLSRFGLEIADLNPGNIMFTKTGGIKIIDGEFIGIVDPNTAARYNYRSITSKLFESEYVTWIKQTFLNRGINTPKIPEAIKPSLTKSFNDLDPSRWQRNWYELCGNKA